MLLRNAPLISVVMPVFNAEKDLNAAIESILQQSFNDFEFLIINDGSSDKSKEIILATNDPRIRLLNKSENEGLVVSLNLGLSEARGQFIARMDADDISMPYRLMKQLKLMQQMNLDICGSDWAQIDEHGLQFATLKAPSSREQLVAVLATTVPYAHGGVMMRKAFLDEHRLQYRNGYGEDYELWIRFFECGARFGAVEEILYLHRSHPNSITSIKFEEQASASKKLRREFVKNNLICCEWALKALRHSFPYLSKALQVHCLHLAYRYFLNTAKIGYLLRLIGMSSMGVIARFTGRIINA